MQLWESRSVYLIPSDTSITKVKINKSGAKQVFLFLKNMMWDKDYGGFYTFIDRKRNVLDVRLIQGFGQGKYLEIP